VRGERFADRVEIRQVLIDRRETPIEDIESVLNL
jgi:hypothetical protein